MTQDCFSPAQSCSRRYPHLISTGQACVVSAGDAEKIPLRREALTESLYLGALCDKVLGSVDSCILWCLNMFSWTWSQDSQ